MKLLFVLKVESALLIIKGFLNVKLISNSALFNYSKLHSHSLLYINKKY